MTRFHGPDNADFEIRKAYNEVIETNVIYFKNPDAVPGVDSKELRTSYLRAFRSHQAGHGLAAERWARVTKHLARAFRLEAKIAHLEIGPNETDLPYLPDAEGQEYGLIERSDVTVDLLNSCAQTHIQELPPEMARYLARAKKHLSFLSDIKDKQNELLHAAHIQAAHEYGRVLECCTLAFEAESQIKKVS